MKYCLLFLSVCFLSIKGLAQTSIDISTISQHIGDSVIVIGQVSDTSYSQTLGAKILKIAQPGGGSFDVVIRDENRSSFQVLTQMNVFNKYARITGKITSSAGRNQIYVKAPPQLAIILGE